MPTKKKAPAKPRTKSTKTRSNKSKPAASKAKKAQKSAASKSSNKAKSNKAKSSKAKPKPAAETDVVITVDRRQTDRRKQEGDSSNAAPAPALERRKKVQRRRQIDPTTCERDYSPVEVEFMNAMDDYKRKSGRMFPTCSEVLEVLDSLGYVKLTPVELTARSPQEAKTPEAADQTSTEEDADGFPELEIEDSDLATVGEYAV